MKDILIIFGLLFLLISLLVFLERYKQVRNDRRDIRKFWYDDDKHD